MAVPLYKELLTVPQREVAGPRSSSRFSYQKNWALAELIEYHLAGKDYVFAFEFHDDVLILNSESNPTSLQFIQVKTKATGKNWTIRALTKAEKGAEGEPDKLSIVGKLYENKLNFNNHKSELKFVTNAYFSFGKSTSSICANSLDPKDQKTIQSSIQDQLKVKHSVELGDLFFEHSDLSVGDHEEHIKGKLHAFFDTLFGDSHNISVSPWYRSISDQIKKKNDFPPEKVSCFDELIRNKCITRSEIENFIQKVRDSHNTVEYWPTLATQLSSEGYDYKSIIRLQKKWKEYAKDRLEYDNSILKQLEQKVLTEILHHSPLSLSKKIIEIKNALSNEISQTSNLYDSDYVSCIIMWVDCEQL